MTNGNVAILDKRQCFEKLSRKHGNRRIFENQPAYTTHTGKEKKDTTQKKSTFMRKKISRNHVKKRKILRIEWQSNSLGPFFSNLTNVANLNELKCCVSSPFYRKRTILNMAGQRPSSPAILR